MLLAVSNNAYYFGTTSPHIHIMNRFIRLALALAAFPLAAQQAPADLIVTNARIYTVDDSRPVVEALAVRGGRVAFVGDARGALTLKGETGVNISAQGGNVKIDGVQVNLSGQGPVAIKGAIVQLN